MDSRLRVLVLAAIACLGPAASAAGRPIGIEDLLRLQRQGVPSKLMVFPDAGRWIVKPKDFQLWEAAVQDWLQKYQGR